MLPHDLPGDRVPSANQLAHQLHFALGFELRQIGQGTVQPLEIRSVVGVVGKDAVGGEKAVEEFQRCRRCATMSTHTAGVSTTGM